LLHWNVEHLFWDLLMFVMLGAICESRCRGFYYATLLLTAVAIPIAVAWMHPEITEYRGLSGLDTAIFSLLISLQLLRSSHREAQSRFVFGGIWLLLCGKLLYEFWTGQTLFVQDTSFAPIPMAHLVGVVVGLLVAIASRFFNEPKRAATGIGAGIVKVRVAKGET
jgi:rhomboid family GlyGly-CTERM serine protease